MTAVSGFCDHGTVWIGADSAAVSECNLTVRADSKVFRNRDFLFGFTSSFRMGQLLRYSFVPPTPSAGQDIYEFMVTAFVDGVRACLKAGGYAKRENEVEQGGAFLVGYAGRLFTIDSDYQVSESADGYAAVGCAEQILCGALFASQVGISSQDRMKLVLAAAERHSSGVRRPFHIDSI